MAKTILPKIDQAYMLEVLQSLLNIPSPTGYTENAISFVNTELSKFEALKLSETNKGALVAEWPGKSSEAPRALTAHVDTLGAMVKEIKPNGRLKLTPIGGFAWNTVEGEACWVMTQSGEKVRGALLATFASGHVHAAKVNETKRDADTVEIRLDARTNSAEETQEMGVSVGDFVAFDPRVEITNGFIRSRHLDDKSGVAAIIAAIAAMDAAGMKPSQRTTIHISNYEEVGHGAAAGFPDDLFELLTVDMAAVGEGQTSDEFSATLCVKDSGGPYHHAFNQRMRALAETYEIAHSIDIYPYYGSDGEAYWRAGGDVQVALMGPGLDASHNYERTHTEAIIATTQWILAYLLS
jgi:putative aminopeptidase FrvX